MVFGPGLARIGWWIESRLAVRVYRRCRYVTVSESTRDELAELGVDPDRITVVHNGTPEVVGPPVPRPPHPSLVVLGRLVPHKRVELALRATALLSPELPDAGAGGGRAGLVGGAAAPARRRPRHRGPGPVRRLRDRGATSTSCCARSWLMLAPSLKEGWGLTIVEAARARHAVGRVPLRRRRRRGDGRRGDRHAGRGRGRVLPAAVRRLLHDAERRAEMGAARARPTRGGSPGRRRGAAFAEVVAGQLRPAPAAPRPLRDQRVP